MRARLPLNNKLKKRVREEVKNHYESVGEGHSRRTFKLLFVILHEHFGFGTNRILKIMEKVSDLSHDRKEDEVFWAHIDRLLIDHLKLPLEREDYDKMDE